MADVYRARYWKIKIQPLLYLLFAGFSVVMSIFLVWSEILFSVENPTLSMYAIIVNRVGRDGNVS
jgi:hypothetical protein